VLDHANNLYTALSVPADGLDMRHTILGDGAALEYLADGRLSLYCLDEQGVSRVGTFADAAAALAALDAFDLPD
jgi:hypothetical protein